MQIGLLSLTMLSACFATTCPDLPLSYEAITIWLSQAYTVMKLENSLEQAINNLLKAKDTNNATAMSTYKQGFFNSININVEEKTQALHTKTSEFVKDIIAFRKTPKLSDNSQERLNNVEEQIKSLEASSESQQLLQTFFTTQSPLENIISALEQEKSNIPHVHHRKVNIFYEQASKYIAFIKNYAKITSDRDTISEHLQNRTSSANNN